MHCTVNATSLTDGLNIVTRALAARAAREILNGVLLDARDGEITLSCTDGSLSIQTTIPAEIQAEGRLVLPGRLLTEMVRKLMGDITLKSNESGRVSIQCLSYRANIAAMNEAEFPDITETVDGTVITLPQNQLKRMISGVMFAIATDENRQLLTGTLLEVSPVEARLVALDGFRLALQVAQGEFGTEGMRVVIPGRVMNEMSRILSDEEEPCAMTFDNGHMTAVFGQTKLSTVLLMGDYIDYQRILPASFTTEAKVSREDTMTAIDRMSLIAREGKNNLIRLKFAGQSLTITSNAEISDAQQEISADIVGADLEIAFNAKYLNDIIRNVTDDEMIIKLNSNVSPCVIVPAESRDYLFLVLPVRTFQ